MNRVVLIPLVSICTIVQSNSSLSHMPLSELITGADVAHSLIPSERLLDSFTSFNAAKGYEDVLHLHTVMSTAACEAEYGLIQQIMASTTHFAAAFWCYDRVVVVQHSGKGRYSWGASPQTEYLLWRTHKIAENILSSAGIVEVQIVEEPQALAYAIQEYENENHALYITRSADFVRERAYEQIFFSPEYVDQCMQRGHQRLMYGLVSAAHLAEQEAIGRYAFDNRRRELLGYVCEQLGPISFGQSIRLWGKIALFDTGFKDHELSDQLDVIQRRSCGRWVQTMIVMSTIPKVIAVWAALVFFIQRTGMMVKWLANACLCCSIEQGRSFTVFSLLTCGVPADGTWKENVPLEQLPIIRALCGRHTEIAQMLLRRGATLDVSLADKNVPLMCALAKKLTAIIPMLAERIPREQLFDYLYDGDQQWVKDFMCKGAIIKFRNGVGNQVEEEALERLSKLCGRDLVSNTMVIPGKAHRYSPEILKEIALRGGLSELVYRPGDERELENHAIITEHYSQEVITTCRRCIQRRENLLCSMGVGPDIARLLNFFESNYSDS